jgi:hypothetical protein
VLVSQRRDVLYVAGGDQLAGGAELVDDAAGVDVFQTMIALTRIARRERSARSARAPRRTNPAREELADVLEPA